MIIYTRNKSYAPKGNMILPAILLARAHPHQLLLFRFLRFLTVNELFPLSPLPNTILNQLSNIKEDATLLDMVVIPEIDRR
jgi:hypothetical protein